MANKGGRKKGSKHVGKSTLAMVRKFHPEVTQVIDAAEPLEIEVLDEDCKKGRGKSPNACAMARAFVREKYDGAIIAVSRAYVIKGNVATRYETPPSVAREIVSFDRGHTFSPGSYTLSRVSQQHKLGVIKGGKGIPTGTGKKKVYHHTKGIRSL